MAIGDVKTILLNSTTPYTPAAGVNELVVGGEMINNSTGGTRDLQMRYSGNTTWRNILSVSVSADRRNLDLKETGQGSLAGMMLTPDTSIRLGSVPSTLGEVAAFITVREVQAGN